MRTILSILALLLFEDALHAQAAIDATPDRTRKRVEILIEQLASGNDAPPIRGNARRGEDQTIRFPESYDKSHQVRVYSAIQTLLAEEDAAMVAYLCSDAANCFVGQVFPVAGGWVM